MSQVLARPWWRDAVVYQLYVRSFADANGDGRGDLNGIIARLDYLADLGIDAVWLTPCFPSPQLDHGYDVADYFDIEPTYGDLETFDRLIAQSRQRGIKVLMDVVPNHCSDRHVWFQAALHAPVGSRERGRFYFSDGRGDHGELPPNNWKAVFGGSAWSRTVGPDGVAGQWYLHTFTPWQPDFNWDSADVVDHFDAMLRFWFDRGVEGFRVDAVAVAGKAPGLPDAPEVSPTVAETDVWTHNPYSVFWPSAHDVWRHWRKLVDDYEAEHGDRQLVTVSEAYTPGRPDLLLQYVRPDEFHQSFCFDLMISPWNSPMIRASIDDVYALFAEHDAALTWTLNNHDTHRAVTRYGRADATEESSWTGSNLVYTNTPVDIELGFIRARAMILLAAALPGSLYLYQGEELGLPEVLDIAPERRQDPIFARTEGREIGRDGCRVPLPWTTDAHSGFGFSPIPADPWIPQPHDWATWSVETEMAEPDSMLALYRRILALRRSIDPAAPLEWLEDESDGIVGFRRGALVAVLNTTDIEVVLRASSATDMSVVISSRPDHHDPTRLPANSCVWLQAPDRTRSPQA